MDQVRIRPLDISDRGATMEVISMAARWYRDFLPPEELHDPEVTCGSRLPRR